MDNVRKANLIALGFRDEVEKVEHGFCPLCGMPIVFEDFDLLSLQEFNISGLCRSCQKKIFDESK